MYKRQDYLPSGWQPFKTAPRLGAALLIISVLPLAGLATTSQAQEGYSVQDFTIARRDNEQVNPRLSGKYVIWEDYRNVAYGPNKSDAKGDIYGRNLDTNNEIKVTDRHTAARPALSGSRVVYVDSRNAGNTCS